MSKLIADLLLLDKNLKNKGIITRVTPLSSTLIANGNNKTITVSNEVLTYLQTLNFPGTDEINTFKPFKKTYTPLLKLKKTQNLDGMIEFFINYILEDIVISKHKNFKNILQLVLGETIMNVKEHSKFSNLFLTCQKWNNSLEIAILDDGVGFKKSLNIKDEAEAIELAAYQAVSSKKEDLGRGWGLQHLKASVLNDEIKGEFCIISNNNYIHFGDNKIKKGKLNLSANGVLICLRFNNLNEANFEKAYFTALEPNDYLIQNKYLNLH